MAKQEYSWKQAKTELTTQRCCSGEKMRDNGGRRYAMGDKGKKDKDKERKQKINKQAQKAKRKLEKRQRRTP
ncbi:MAG: hypothetical protein GQ565_01745 [Candidatus Aegiribacteria sp.]|nr:hypothetical protein [Candidatus Aegiribacteria sp.]